MRQEYRSAGKTQLFVQRQQSRVSIGNTIQQGCDPLVVRGESVSDPAKHWRPVRERSEVLQDRRRCVIGGDDQDQVWCEPSNSTAEIDTTRHAGPAGQQNAFDGAVQSAIAGATEPNLVAGSLEACHRILGPVRDTATFADNEYLQRLSNQEAAREDIRIR